jgi:hypothetical protein
VRIVEELKKLIKRFLWDRMLRGEAGVLGCVSRMDQTTVAKKSY